MTQSGLLLVIGVITSVAVVDGVYLNFVKPVLQIPLLLASAVLLVMGGYGIWEDRGHPERDRGGVPPHHGGGPPSRTDGHDHSDGPRVGWLLVVPFLVLGAIVPPPLGAYSAAEDTGLVTVTSAEGLDGLPTGDLISITLAEFQGRALYDPERSLQDRRVRLVGFASPGRPGEWLLTRMALNCCAADGFAVKVRVANAPSVADDQWVEVVGTWKAAPLAAPDTQDLPVVTVESLRRVGVPENPYE